MIRVPRGIFRLANTPIPSIRDRPVRMKSRFRGWVRDTDKRWILGASRR